MRASNANCRDQCGLAGGGVLGGGFAERGAVAFDVEQVVGDLERLADRRAVTVDVGALSAAGLAQDRAGAAGETNERAGLHRLQGGDFGFGERALAGKAAFRGEIEHLAAGHAAETRRARQFRHQCDAHARVGMHLGARHNIEGKSQQRVAGENCGGFVESFVNGRAAAPQVVVVHRRQIVMHQRVAVQALERGAGQQSAGTRRAEQRPGLHQQKWAQSFAAAQYGMAHGGEQTLRPRRLAG